jgi:polyphosphate kinase
MDTPSPMSTADLERPELYLNRELSLLAFNRRVLEQARDEQLPLLERLRFLCIASSNLDEFFEIRVAGLKQRAEGGSGVSGPDALGIQELLRAISERARALVQEQYKVLNNELIPALQAAGINLIRRKELSKSQDEWLRKFFRDELTPVLTPMGLDPAHPFPRIINKSLNFIVSLEGKDAFGRSSGLAVVQAPRSLPRVIQLPASKDTTGLEFVFLSSIIHAFVDDLFPGMKTRGCYQFRVTRNSDLFVDEEEVDDLARALAGELPQRRYGDAVRLEVADDCPAEIVKYLTDHFEIGSDDVYRADGPVNLNRLAEIYDRVDRPELKFPAFTSKVPRVFERTPDLFEAIAHQDILLHHPYEAFAPVIDLLRQAAADPNVLAIKQTLYRTGPDSVIVDALTAAARAGKEVTVVVELRARFDEEANLALANRLQQAGAHVLYGVVGYKTHAKMTLVVRREGRKLRRYVHLSTGNYHPRTARIYTDYGLLTSERDICEDVHDIFNQLTSLGKMTKLHRLLQSPFTLHKALVGLIEREAKHAAAGRKARIVAKMNALVEPSIIQALYRASMAGVEVELIVRGMCSLRPGVPGISDRIRVRSVIGRFLEHTRAFHFHNDGEAEVYLSSADLMERNFFRRVEVCFPLLDGAARDRVIADLKRYLKDNTQAWELGPDGEYRRISPGKDKPVSAQLGLLNDICA